jgi:DNA polymerase I-like protein with 3'-5' exonuclease and polymerase domains
MLSIPEVKTSYQVHDELVFDVHKSGIRKNKPILKHQKWKMPLKWKLVDVFKTMLDWKR